MALSFAGNGTITGLSVGGLPDGVVDEDTLANNAVASGKLASGVGGKLLQRAYFQTGVYATGTTLFPLDNTIPQITEGNEYMALAFTPTSATSILEIQCTVHCNTSSASKLVSNALFVSGTSDALASGIASKDASAYDTQACHTFTHTMVAGVTTQLDFSVRGGVNAAATYTFNGYSGATYGGTIASSIIIREYAP